MPAISEHVGSPVQNCHKRGNMRHCRRCICASILTLVVLFAWQPQRAGAQVVKGSISGTVLDAHGAVIPRADIQATNQSTGEQYATLTDDTGLFHLALVSIGTYNVAISKEGFKTLTL